MKNILMIDDDQFMRDVVATKLTDSEHRITVASSGEEGFAKIETDIPNLILLDLDLPDMSGIDILTELKDDEVKQSIPVIIFSNNDDEEVKMKTKMLGADAFFVKVSIDINELRQKIEAVLKSTS